MKRLGNYPELMGLVLASFATRLWDLFSPHAVVFDEVYFKAFAGHYLDHRYFFDIHPPLTKLLFAGWAALLHIPATSLVGSDPSVTLRLLPALAGALLVPVFWGILRRLGASRPFAFLGALAVLLDNALLVESRFILMDSLLLLFGLGCVYFFLVARTAGRRSRWVWLVLAALAGGAAGSTKWTGLTALGVIGLIWLADLREHFPTIRRLIGELTVLVIIPVIVYVSVFAIHFALLTRSGDGDAFMSTKFQSTLVGSSYYDPHTRLGFVPKFMELNKEMFKANQTLTATHPYGSRWYTWPLELRPIYYWQGTTDAKGNQGNIYLLGNPVVWWGLLIAGITGLVYARMKPVRLRPETIAALSLTALAYLANFIPFVGVTRVMFLYHYFFSFLFSLAFVVLLWNDLTADRNGKNQLATQASRYAFAGICAAIVFAWLFFAPISYGTPLSPAGLQARMWLSSWR